MSDNQFLDDPYNPQVSPLDSETLPLDEIIRQAFDGMMLEIHTVMPAKVTKVTNDSYVNVQPLFKRTYQDGTQVDLPEVQGVPVLSFSGADYFIKAPIAVDDLGVIIFAERSMDNWVVSNGGKTVDPQDVRHHDLSDAIFLPGLRTMGKPLEGTAEDLIINNGSAKIVLQKSGKFLVKNDSAELFDLLDQLLDVLANKTFTTTLLGPQPFLASTVALLTQIRTQLGTLKGS